MGKIRVSHEKSMQKSILEWLYVAYPMIKAWKVNSVGTFSKQRGCFLKPDKYTKKGVSDLIGIFPNGTWLAIEVKIKPNKPTPEQLDFLNMIADHSGISMWVYNIEQVETNLKQELQKNPHLLHKKNQDSQASIDPYLQRIQ